MEYTTPMGATVSHTPLVKSMLEADLETIQEDQLDFVSLSTEVSKDHFSHQCLDIVKQGIKLVEDVPEKRKEFAKRLQDILSHFSTKESSKRKRDAAPTEHGEFPVSTHYKTNKVKRKGR